MQLPYSSGLFFTVYAVSLIFSRLYAGQMVDKGKVTRSVLLGLAILGVSLLGLSMCRAVNARNAAIMPYFFLGVAVLCGLGFGTCFPSFNTLFINLATNSQRGTATSTYLTSWDVGLGIGILCGGVISEHFSFASAYLIADIMVVASLVFFVGVVAPHYLRNKIGQ